MKPQVRKRIVEMWMDGKEIPEIREVIKKEFGEDYEDDEIMGVIPKVETVKQLEDTSPDAVFAWLYEWQLKRLIRYRDLEEKMNVPIPDVKSNIALMLKLIALRAGRDSAMVLEKLRREIFGEVGEDGISSD